jgi:hypothetical protein
MKAAVFPVFGEKAIVGIHVVDNGSRPAMQRIAYAKAKPLRVIQRCVPNANSRSEGFENPADEPRAAFVVAKEKRGHW